MRLKPSAAPNGKRSSWKTASCPCCAGCSGPHWQGTQLALALHATTLGLRFTVLAVSVVYRGCAIPVAWTILPANQPAAWRSHWLRLLRLLRPAIPKGHTVIVLAIEGHTAPASSVHRRPRAPLPAQYRTPPGFPGLTRRPPTAR